MPVSILVFPLIALLVALLGSRVTRSNMSWYKLLRLPAWIPSGAVIGIVWTYIYILTTISAYLVWNSSAPTATIWIIMGMFLLNAILNVLWSVIYFGEHYLYLAVFECMVLELTVFGLILLILPVSPVAAVMLVPYFVWVLFATFLNYITARLNNPALSR